MRRVSLLSAILALLGSVIFPSCADRAKERSPMESSQAFREDLRRVGSLRVYFGHQSVGLNILDGLSDIAGPDERRYLNIQPLEDVEGITGPFFAHSMVGRNNDPESKCTSFASALDKLKGNVDIAILKFCFVDVRYDRDVEKMFAVYCSTLDSLKGRFPDVIFVHCTVPLAERTPWWRRAVKSLLGRTDTGDLANVKRRQLNDMIRSRFAREPLFDIAALESASPNGTSTKYVVGDQEAYSLASEYTDDGGHLNELGRQLAAKELLRVISEAARIRGQ